MLNNLKFSYNQIIKYINFGLAILILLFLPILKSIIPLLIILWIFTWFLEGNFKNKIQNQNLKDNYLIFTLCIIFYLIQIIGYFYSENSSEAIYTLETRLSIILFPFFIATSNNLYKINYRVLLWSFVIGNIFASLICLSYAFYNSLSFESGYIVFDTIQKARWPHDWKTSIIYDYNYFSSSLFSILHHPSYFALYLNFSLVILISFLKQKLYNLRMNMIIYLCSILFYIMIFLLSSRTGIFTSIIILFYFLYIYFKKIKSYYFRIIIIFLGIGLSIFFILNNKRFESIKNIFSNEKDKFGEQTDYSRINLWKATNNVIKSNLFFGVGTGDVKDEIVKEYSKKMKTDNVIRLNSHNQYLEIWAANGIFAFLILLYIIFIPFYNSIKHKKFLFFFFLLLIIINISVESMFNTIAGVVFFAFFYNFLLYVTPSETEKLKP